MDTKKILSIVCLLVFSSTVDADLTGKKLLCEYDLNSIEKGDYVGLTFKSDFDVEILRFRYKDNYRKDKCLGSECADIKYNGVKYWDGSYSANIKKVKVYKHKDKTEYVYSFPIVIDRETLEAKEEFYYSTLKNDSRHLGTCKIVEVDFEPIFKDLSNQWTKSIEEFEQKQKSKNKL